LAQEPRSQLGVRSPQESATASSSTGPRGECEDAEADSVTDSGRKLKHKVPAGYSFVYGGLEPSDQTRVVVEAKWDRPQDLKDKFQQNVFLKARVGFGMHAALEACPSLGPQDLAVVHRQTPKGLWKTDVWTKKRFAPRELLVPCVASELREFC